MLLNQQVDVRDRLAALTSPVDEGPAVEPQRRLLGIGQRTRFDHLFLDRREGVAATHAGGDLRLDLLERGHGVHLISLCRSLNRLTERELHSWCPGQASAGARRRRYVSA